MGVDNAHDLTGQIFQRLISDRKYLATFYTRPASAALLARLAINQLEGVDWGDAEAIGKLRVGDFACGTGALLSAVYEQIAERHANAGGDPSQLHRAMMEEVIYGCDVMPSAIHITGSTLIGQAAQRWVQPVPPVHHGLRPPTGPDGEDWLAGTAAVLGCNDAVQHQRSGASHRKRRRGDRHPGHRGHPRRRFRPGDYESPFTRANNHEGAHADVTNPAFAAFDATQADQTAMGQRINQLERTPAITATRESPRPLRRWPTGSSRPVVS